jgi:hypothetical protein
MMKKRLCYEKCSAAGRQPRLLRSLRAGDSPDTDFRCAVEASAAANSFAAATFLLSNQMRPAFSMLVPGFRTPCGKAYAARSLMPLAPECLAQWAQQ